MTTKKPQAANKDLRAEGGRYTRQQSAKQTPTTRKQNMTRERMKPLREKKTTNQMKAGDIHRNKSMSTA